MFSSFWGAAGALVLAVLALARAIVRRSKLLILDEATSAIGESLTLLLHPCVLM